MDILKSSFFIIIAHKYSDQTCSPKVNSLFPNPVLLLVNIVMVLPFRGTHKLASKMNVEILTDIPLPEKH